MKWAERISRAETAGKFTDEDLSLSFDWPTCEWGETQERPGETGPEDDKLYDWGQAFDLLAAAKAALDFMPVGQPETRQLREAIAKATSPQTR